MKKFKNFKNSMAMRSPREKKLDRLVDFAKEYFTVPKDQNYRRKLKESSWESYRERALLEAALDTPTLEEARNNKDYMKEAPPYNATASQRRRVNTDHQEIQIAGKTVKVMSPGFHTHKQQMAWIKKMKTMKEELTPREQQSHEERLKSTEPPKFDSNEQAKKQQAEHDKNTLGMMKNIMFHKKRALGENYAEKYSAETMKLIDKIKLMKKNKKSLLGRIGVLNRKTVQEAFKAAKDKKNTKSPQKDEKRSFAKKDIKPQKELQDNLPDEGSKEPNKDVSAAPPQFGADKVAAGAPGAEKKVSNTPTPEKKSAKVQVKGPGPDDKFQADPIVTPLTTMPDTASPKSGSQGVR